VARERARAAQRGGARVHRLRGRRDHRQGPARHLHGGGERDPVTAPIGLPLREVEKQFVLRTLAAENNNKTRAADRLGISTKTLHNMLQRWGLLRRQIPRGGSA
jgi:DNA-binding NtrC family response regulator